jgi:hypothetical protein
MRKSVLHKPAVVTPADALAGLHYELPATHTPNLTGLASLELLMPSPTICVGTARHCLTGALAIHPQAGWSELCKELSGLALAVGAGLVFI